MSDKRLNILEGIEKGISPSYLGAFNKLVNVDLDTTPGIVIPSWKLTTQNPTASTTYSNYTITVNTGTDVVIVAGVTEYLDIFKPGQSVRFTTTGTLPAGISPSTTYFILPSSTGNNLQIASSLKNYVAGTQVDITDSGTGTHTLTAETVGALIKIVPTGLSRFTFVAIENAQKIWIYDNTYESWLRITGDSGLTNFGIAVWKNYIISMKSGQLDAYGPIEDTFATASWTNNFSLPFDVSSSYHPVKIMSNEILYVGDGKYIYSLEEAEEETFDPLDTDTFVDQPQALDLPSFETAMSLEELSGYLMIGTNGKGLGRIYSWDSWSPSFSSIFETSTREVSTMISIDGVLYFFDSYLGVIYATNGSSINIASKISESSLGISQLFQGNPVNINIYGGSVLRFKNKILFGVSGNYMPGIYSYNLENGALDLEYTVNSGTTTSANFYALAKISNVDFMVSVYDPTLAQAVRYQVQNLEGYKAESAIIETGLMAVGTKRSPRTFEFFEIELGKELASGEIITLYYRTNLTDTWTTIGTMSYTADGAIASKIIQNSVVQADQIQFKCLITCGSTATAGPEIKTIYIY